MRARTTSELIVLMMASVVCITVLIGAVGVGLVEVLHPEMDTDAILILINDVIRVMLGAVIGFGAANWRGGVAWNEQPTPAPGPNVKS